MKTVRYRINYGNFIGCDEEYEVPVGDDATQDEIESIVADDYENKVLENCYFDIR